MLDIIGWKYFFIIEIIEQKVNLIKLKLISFFENCNTLAKLPITQNCESMLFFIICLKGTSHINIYKINLTPIRSFL